MQKQYLKTLQRNVSKEFLPRSGPWTRTISTSQIECTRHNLPTKNRAKQVRESQKVHFLNPNKFQGAKSLNWVKWEEEVAWIRIGQEWRQNSGKASPKASPNARQRGTGSISLQVTWCSPAGELVETLSGYNLPRRVSRAASPETDFSQKGFFRRYKQELQAQRWSTRCVFFLKKVF